TLTDFGHNFQAIFAQTLKCVRRSARLVRSTAKESRAGAGHSFSNCECLFWRLDRAGPGNNAQIAAAKTSIAARKMDYRVFFLHVAADQLVGLADADGFLHARHLIQAANLHGARITSNANGRALRAGNWVSTITKGLDLFTDGTYLLFRGVRLHHD